MKPKTKLQKEAYALSQTLAELTDKQIKQAIDKITLSIAKVRKDGVAYCLECGHQWKTDGHTTSEKITCPHCHRVLKIDTSRQRKFEFKTYVSVITCRGDFQIVRVFLVKASYKVGKPSRYEFLEAFQRWFHKSGKEVIIARSRNMTGYYIDLWSPYSELEVREAPRHRYGYGVNPAYSIDPGIYIGQSRYISTLKRNGFDGSFHKCSAYDLIKGLLTDSRVETIWKCGMYDVANYCFNKYGILDTYWDSIKIAIRHKYAISDVPSWFDMLACIAECGKDLRNVKLICPDDLTAEHDKWVAKRAAKQAKDEAIRERERIRRIEELYYENLEKSQKENEQYLESHSKFLDLVFTEGNLTVQPLQSVKDFLEEGQKMHHCVYTNKYYTKNDTLIFHALVAGVSIATIEFNLNSFKIIQCRGVRNSIPPHNERIINLITQNVHQIQKRLKAA